MQHLHNFGSILIRYFPQLYICTLIIIGCKVRLFCLLHFNFRCFFFLLTLLLPVLMKCVFFKTILIILFISLVYLVARTFIKTIKAQVGRIAELP